MFDQCNMPTTLTLTVDEKLSAYCRHCRDSFKELVLERNVFGSRMEATTIIEYLYYAKPHAEPTELPCHYLSLFLPTQNSEF